MVWILWIWLNINNDDLFDANVYIPRNIIKRKIILVYVEGKREGDSYWLPKVKLCCLPANPVITNYSQRPLNTFVQNSKSTTCNTWRVIFKINFTCRSSP